MASALQTWIDSNPTSGTYYLESDITIDNTFTPTGSIGGSARLDGNGKTITITATNFTGLLNLAGGTIRNFKVIPSGTLSSASQYGWVLKNGSYSSDIFQVTVQGNLTSNSGGFIGKCDSSGTLVFSSCVFQGQLSPNSAGFVYEGRTAILSFAACVTIVGGFSSSVSDSNPAAGFVLRNSPNLGSGSVTAFTVCASYLITSDPGSGYAGYCYQFPGPDYSVSLVMPTCNRCYFYASSSFSGGAFIYLISGGDGTGTGTKFVDGNYSFSGGSLTGRPFAGASGSGSTMQSPVTPYSGDTYGFVTNSSVDITLQTPNSSTVQSNWNGSNVFSAPSWSTLSTSPPTLINFYQSPWINYAPLNNPPTINYALVCVMEGTLILTPSGEIPIEKLKKGDKIITLSGETEIVQIYSKHVFTNSDSAPCLIPQHAYGENKPHTDLYITQWHALWLENKFKHTSCLNYKPLPDYVNKEITYYHICVKEYPEVMYANGLGVETSALLHHPHVRNECTEEECKIFLVNDKK